MANRFSYVGLSAAAGASLLLLTGVGAAAEAKSPQDTVVIAPRYPEALRTVRVSQRDLDLSNRAGRKMLVARVDAAARTVCEDSLYEGGLDASQQSHCFDAAWAGARPQIYRAQRRAVEMARNGFSSIAPAAIIVSAAL